MPDRDRASELASLTKQLHSRRVEDRRLAASELDRLGDPRAVEPLIAALRDTDAVVRANAATAIGTLGDKRAVEPLIALLHDANRDVRIATIGALGWIGDARAVEPLIAALRDEDQSVHDRAGWALVKIGTPEARDAFAAWRAEQPGISLASPSEEVPASELELKESASESKPQEDFGMAQADDAPIPKMEESTEEAEEVITFGDVAPPAEMDQAAEEITTATEAPADAEAHIDAVIGGAAPATSYGAPPPAPAAQPAPAEPEPARPAPTTEPEREVAKRERAQRKAGKRRAAPGEVASQEAGKVGVDQRPHFAAFYPAQVAPATKYTLMVFAHIDSARAQIEQIAANFAHLMGDQQTSTSAPSKHLIAVGSQLTVVPQIPGLVFAPTMQVTPWVPPYVSFTFTFETPAALAADLTGRILVLDGALLAGEIPITIRHALAAEDAATDLNQSAEMNAFDPVFASYSHHDTPVMEYFRKARARLGQKMLVDVYDLRSGEHWADRLLEMIDQSAVFQLFWSAHSAQSKYCRQEWEHALTLIKQRPRFVQPVYWAKPGPTPSPPPELADLHFQHIPLPPLTRVQMVTAGIRRALGLR